MFESFRHRDFRLFWAGSLVSNVGTWMQMYALSIVVFSFRRSSFDLGLVGFVSGIPTLFLALPAGAMADRVDRRRLLVVIQVVLLVGGGGCSGCSTSRGASARTTRSPRWSGSARSASSSACSWRCRPRPSSRSCPTSCRASCS